MESTASNFRMNSFDLVVFPHAADMRDSITMIMTCMSIGNSRSLIRMHLKEHFLVCVCQTRRTYLLWLVFLLTDKKKLFCFRYSRKKKIGFDIFIRKVTELKYDILSQKLVANATPRDYFLK